MAERRRPRPSTEEKRKRILDATEEIMLEDGYAAVSSRSVATAVGIQAPLVHYYFATLDDLFVGVLQRRAGRNVELMAGALASPEPLRAWWTLASDPRGTALFVELLAAANHRPALKVEVGRIAHEVRRMQMDALDTLLVRLAFPTAAVGVALLFTKVAVKPGAPLVFGHRGRTLVFGLPGNPVSVSVTFNLFTRTALLAMQGANEPVLKQETVMLARTVKGSMDRESYLPAQLMTNDDGELIAPWRDSPSGGLTPASAAPIRRGTAAGRRGRRR